MNNTHHENFKIFCDTLNNNNIRFVFIRGYQFLPEKPDTDLDTVIHPDDWNNFLNIRQDLINKNIIGFENHGIFKNYGTDKYRKMIYDPLFTKGTHGNHLPNKSFRLDIYSDIYFFENSNTGIALPIEFLNYLFNNRGNSKYYYIPNTISNIIMLICRNIYDKNNNWAEKHKNIINMSINTVNPIEFSKVCNMFFNKNQNIYELLIKKQFKLIRKPTKMLFLIRKNGLERHTNIIDYTTQLLKENNYIIEDEGLITINNKEKTFTSFYNDKINNNEIKDAILNANDNKCYYLITDYNNYKKTSVEIKNILRTNFPNPDNIHWNYFHSSDNNKEAYREIDILKSNINSFHGIGTYYSQKES